MFTEVQVGQIALEREVSPQLFAWFPVPGFSCIKRNTVVDAVAMFFLVDDTPFACRH